MSFDRFGDRVARPIDAKIGQLDAERVELAAQMHGQAEEEAGTAEGQHAGDEHLHRLDDHERLARRFAPKHAGQHLVRRLARVVDLAIDLDLLRRDRRYRHEDVNTHYDTHQEKGECRHALGQRRVFLHDPTHPLVLLRGPIVHHGGDHLEQLTPMDARCDEPRES